MTSMRCSTSCVRTYDSRLLAELGRGLHDRVVGRRPGTRQPSHRQRMRSAITSALVEWEDAYCFLTRISGCTQDCAKTRAHGYTSEVLGVVGADRV
jgi:hypothetical protein